MEWRRLGCGRSAAVGPRRCAAGRHDLDADIVAVAVAPAERRLRFQDGLHQAGKGRVDADDDGVELARNRPQAGDGCRSLGEDMRQVLRVAAQDGVEFLSDGRGVIDTRTDRVLHLDQCAQHQVGVRDLPVDRRILQIAIELFAGNDQAGEVVGPIVQDAGGGGDVGGGLPQRLEGAVHAGAAPVGGAAELDEDGLEIRAHVRLE